MQPSSTSGNSLNKIQSTEEGEFLFIKRHGAGRRYEYFRELLASKYLCSLDTSFTAEVLSSNNKDYQITFSLLHPVSSDDKSAETDYFECLASIHKAISASTLKFPLVAKEAFTNSDDVILSISKRIERLLATQENIKQPNSIYACMKELLVTVQPLINRVFALLEVRPPESEMLFNHADLGLHNCVRDDRGNLLIIDLEYSGMDSPVKQFYDCLLAPRNNFRDSFVASWSEYFTNGRICSNDLRNMRVYGATFAIKWMLIVLNEFVSEHWERRIFAQPQRLAQKEKILRMQLRKASIYAKMANEILEGSSLVPQFQQSEKAQLSESY